MKFSTKYDNHSHELAGFDCSIEAAGSLVRSEFVQDCDINNIMARYSRTGIIDHVSAAQAAFEDVSELGDYQAMLSVLSSAQEAFMQLPAAVRFRMGNDPSQLVDFLADSENFEFLARHGILQVERLSEVSSQSAAVASSSLEGADPASEAR